MTDCEIFLTAGDARGTMLSVLSNHPQEGGADDGSEEQSLYGEFGIPHEFLPDDQSPPVDDELLRCLARRELPAEELERVHHLLVSYRPWSEAYAKVLGAEGGDKQS